MYEIWYSDKAVPHVTLKATYQNAMAEAIKIVLDDSNILDALVDSSNGAILTNQVYDFITTERIRRREQQARASGNPWLVEVLAKHRVYDHWAVLSAHPDQATANNRVALVAGQIDASRVRAREVPPAPAP